MKKQFLTAVAVMSILTFAGTQLKAQSKSSIANTTQVNVTLADIIGAAPGTPGSGATIADAGKNSAGATTETLDFSYATNADYGTTKELEKLKTITAMSSRPYKVSVKASGSDLTLGTEKIPVSILRIKAKKSSDATYSASEITPSTTDQVLFPDEKATSAASYDVKYSIPKEEIAKYVTKTAGIYTITLYYTLETK